MKNKWHTYQAEIDRIVQEKTEEWNQKHTAKVETKYGNTYISYGVYDYITGKGMYILQKLFGLMGIECAMCIPPINTLVDNEYRCFVSIEGEDQERVAFIQKFIDNGYKLNWK